MWAGGRRGVLSCAKRQEPCLGFGSVFPACLFDLDVLAGGDCGDDASR